MAGEDNLVEITQMVPLVIGLTRRHYKRLRWYWAGHHTPASSLTDAIDLDLVGVGLIARAPERAGRGVCFVITEAGERELAAEHQREIQRRSPHHELGGRLASWLRSQGRITWENIQFTVESAESITYPGTDVVAPEWRGTVRPDVFSMATTYDPARMNPCVHEVKVSRSDFLADLSKPEKRRGYTHISEVLYYACPNEMIDAEEVPPECGLVYETEVGKFTVVKKPKRRKTVLSAKDFMNLILKPGQFKPLV